MVNDTLSDLVSRVKNGYRAAQDQIVVPWSRVKEAVVVVLKEAGYVGEYQKKDNDLVIKLKYHGKEPALTDITRISKPGVRIYTGARDLKKIARGIGIGIVSTPKGIMSHKEAQKLHVGGEIICRVW